MAALILIDQTLVTGSDKLGRRPNPRADGPWPADLVVVDADGALIRVFRLGLIPADVPGGGVGAVRRVT